MWVTRCWTTTLWARLIIMLLWVTILSQTMLRLIAVMIWRMIVPSMIMPGWPRTSSFFILLSVPLPIFLLAALSILSRRRYKCRRGMLFLLFLNNWMSACNKRLKVEMHLSVLFDYLIDHSASLFILLKRPFDKYVTKIWMRYLFLCNLNPSTGL